MKTSQFMLFEEMFAVSSNICPEHRYVLCGQIVQFFMVTTDGMYSNQQIVKV